MNPRRPLPFVLAAANHGSMIVNRLDYRMVDEKRGYGVGYQILNSACFDPEEINFVLALLTLRRKHAGDGLMVLDCGANIGAHTIEWARHMHGWGQVLAFEPQERIFYALAGNIALNNCLNASARWVALGRENTTIKIPAPNYLIPSSFGSLELKQTASTEFIGQDISYDEQRMVPVAQISIDSLALPRVDLMKIDVEGMELEVLAGAQATLEKYKPVLMVEVIKTDLKTLETTLRGYGYALFRMGINLLAVYEQDPVLAHLKLEGEHLNLRM
jgi:FkbM family methyltransferase